MGAHKRKKEVLDVVSQDDLYFRARDCVWKRVRTKGDQWVCELVKEGHSFTDRPRQVNMYPYLENIEPIKTLFKRPDYREHPSNSRPAEEDALRVRTTNNPMSMSQFEEQFLGSSILLKENSAIQFKNWQYLPLLKALEAPFPRILIADDVGLGKTTEAALILQHLVNVGRADRILVICPAHLCEKWQSELGNRFGIQMEIFDRETRRRLSNQGVRNTFEVSDRIIVSMDFVKRFENLKPLSKVEFDCVIVDECHHFIAGEVGATTRLRELAETICIKSPSLLLLSATPFRGGNAEFESLLSLLDPLANERDDGGNLTPNAEKIRKRSMVRRIKRDVSLGDFPERQVRHVECEPESTEEKLAVEKLKSFRDSLLNDTSSDAPHLLAEIFQKRASSSWNALLQTLKSHEEKIKSKNLEKHQRLASELAASVEKFAVNFNKQKKFEQFLKILDPILTNKKRVVVFTEYIDTLDLIYLALKSKFPQVGIGCITGSDCWANIRGSEIRSNIRRSNIEKHFSTENGHIQVLICTDTCSEGIDLQKQCHHLIHFELPWSLVKLEQRNGRIDRFGQTQPPQIINMVFKSEATRDQAILAKIADRIELARKNIGSISAVIDESDRGIKSATNTSLLRGEDISDAFGDAFEGNATANNAPPPYQAPVLIEMLARPQGNEAKLPLWELNRMILNAVLENDGGGLKETGTKGVYSLWLPEGWETGGQYAAAYPTQKSPWKVIFNPKIAVEQETRIAEQQAAGIDTGDRLHFLNSSHPVIDAAKCRYQLTLFKNESIPVLQAPLGENSTSALVVEATLLSRGERGIVLWKDFLLVDQDGDLLRDEIFKTAALKSAALKTGAGKSSKVPTEKQWKKMLEMAGIYGKQQAASFMAKQKSLRDSELKSTEAALSADLEKRQTRRTRFLKAHLESRVMWLDELCFPAINEETKEPAVRIQPFALLLG